MEEEKIDSYELSQILQIDHVMTPYINKLLESLGDQRDFSNLSNYTTTALGSLLDKIQSFTSTMNAEIGVEMFNSQNFGQKVELDAIANGFGISTQKLPLVVSLGI